VTDSLDIVLPAGEHFSAAGGGAIATVSYEVGRALRDRGVGVCVISSFFTGQPLPDLDVLRLDFGRPRPFVQRAALRAREKIPGRHVESYQRFRGEVIAALSTRLNPVVVHNDPLLARELAGTGRRVVLWLHNMIEPCRSGSFATLPASVRLVTVSDYVRQWTAEKHRVPPETIVVIHNGVDTKRFKPVANYIPNPRLQLVCHGRIDPNKGQVMAARAVAALRAEGLPVELTIVGQPRTFGMSRARVQEYSECLRLAVRAADARVTGWLPSSEIASLLRKFDIALMLPTVPDPFPLAGLEAMASGCALVAAPLGGVAELAGEAAVLVDADEASVANGIRTLVTDRAELLRRRQLSRERALCFSWSDAAGRLLDVLDIDSEPKSRLAASALDSG
jgi:glycosyltransferase involved in cell wall biosynthesis